MLEFAQRRHLSSSSDLLRIDLPPELKGQPEALLASKYLEKLGTDVDEASKEARLVYQQPYGAPQ
jgi:hypothetical protein